MAKQILVVDDDSLVRAFLRDCLAALGFQVREAGDGQEALARLNEAPAELMLLDLLMPRMSGMQVLVEVRARHPACRVLVVSSLDADTLIAHALEAGAAGFIAKPFHPVEVKSAVVQALQSEPPEAA